MDGVGMLVLAVGPSGAGKDTLLREARVTLEHDPRFRFVRRVITRAPGDEAEDHEPAEPAEFEARRASGGFALAWNAHGLSYGIPADIAGDIEARRVVIANVSRTCIGEAAARFPLRVIEITAPTDTLARRLALRGREDAVDAARRLARAVKVPENVPKETIVNDSTVEEGARRLVAALTRAAEDARSG
jgi:ribose 1,5-bisphosphokinase